MNSVLEQQRRLHEEIERIENAIVDELLVKPKAHKEKIIQEHRVNNYLELIQERSKLLKDYYDDKDGSRKKEINSISGAQEFSEFYQRLKNIKDHHRRNPNEIVEPMELEFKIDDVEREEAEIDNMFTGEEAWKYFDLHIYHEQYINLKNVENLNYLNYLDKFDKFDSIPMATKLTHSYMEYISGLKKYFEDYFRKAQPLYNIEELQRVIENEFKEAWEEGTLPGWPKEDQMEEDDNDLFCIACKKQFQNKTVYEYHLNGKKT
jgi:splicing factor 3A subunit 3